MTSHVSRSSFGDTRPHETHREHDLARFAALAGRLFYSAIFVMTIVTHFMPQTAAHAASQGVPMANVLVPLSGVIATLGGLSIALGYRAKLGAWLIVLFLVPVTLWMHAFWKISDPQMVQVQQAMFMKNLSLLGGALLIAYFGSGPFSLDARSKR
jgi:putative oxidoreductase